MSPAAYIPADHWPFQDDPSLPSSPAAPGKPLGPLAIGVTSYQVELLRAWKVSVES